MEVNDLPANELPPNFLMLQAPSGFRRREEEVRSWMFTRQIPAGCYDTELVSWRAGRLEAPLPRL